MFAIRIKIMRSNINSSFCKYFSDWKKQPLSLLLIFLIFCFICVKATLVSFTWDEAASYILFVQYNNWMPNETQFLDANNHIINTFFMIIEDHYFAKSVGCLRLHSIISFLIYALAAFSISKGLMKKERVFLLLTILTLHPYFIDFFSLARGYAMSLAFEMLALALLFSFITNASIYAPTLVIVSSCFATLCNFSLLNFQLAIFAVTILAAWQLYIQKEWSLFKLIATFLPGWLITGIFLKLLLPFLFKLKENGNLYFGGKDGFWENTVNSLANSLTYHSQWQQLIQGSITFIFIATFLAVPIWLMLKIKNKNDVLWRKLMAVFLLLIIIILSTITQHHFLQTPYLMERTSLLFVPLILVLLATLLSCINSKISLLLCALFFSIHFISSITFTSVVEWKFNAHNQKAFDIISQLPLPEGRTQINFSAAFEYSMVLNFYTLFYQSKTIAPIKTEIEYFDTESDYFMYSKKYKNSLKLPPVKEIYSNNESEFVIAKRAYPYQNKIIDKHLMILNSVCLSYDSVAIENDRGWAMSPENFYSHSFKLAMDSTMMHKNSFIEMNVLLKTNTSLTNDVGLTYNVYRNKRCLDYKYCELYNLLNNNINNWVPVKFAFPLPKNREPGDLLSSFVINNFKQSVEYKQFHITIFHYNKP